MKLGVKPLARGIADPAWMARFADSVERVSAESVWMFEHVGVPASYESVYPFDPPGKMSGPPLRTCPTRCSGCSTSPP